MDKTKAKTAAAAMIEAVRQYVDQALSGLADRFVSKEEHETSLQAVEEKLAASQQAERESASQASQEAWERVQDLAMGAVKELREQLTKDAEELAQGLRAQFEQATEETVKHYQAKSQELDQAIAQVKALRPEHGRDALEVDVLPGINLERSYPPRTFASHLGGLWVSRRQTCGMDGWECVVDGVADVQVSSEDERKAALVVHRSSGAKVEQVFTFDVPLYRGVYDAGHAYEKGDCVTFGGSLWVAQKSGPGRPDSDAGDWRLAVKRGRDGRRGEDGKRGEKGKDGADGSFISQTMRGAL